MHPIQRRRERSDMELKPCPFCGKVPEVPKNHYDLGFGEDCDAFSIYCSPGCGTSGPSVDGVWNCDEPTEKAEFDELLPRVVESWNRRA